MFVFVDAKEGHIHLSVDQKDVGRARTAPELALLFAANNISYGTSIHCSSSIDFCEEEGFEEGAAVDFVSEAIEMVEV
jgi:hypothetical protein